MITNQFLKSFEAGLQAEMLECGVTQVPLGHTTGWRTLPGIVTAALGYPACIRYKDQKPIPVPPHEALCISTGVLHKLDVETGNGGTSRWSHTAFRLPGGIDICTFITLPSVIAAPLAETIGRLNAELAGLTIDGIAAVGRRKRLLFELLECFLAAGEPRSDSALLAAGLQRVAPAMDHIAARLDSHFGSEILADLCGLSRPRFDALFRRAVGMPPGRYVQRLRLQRAQQMLITTTDTVDMIAASCGYPDQFHFSRLFKKHCGMSPTDYRRKAGM